MSHWAIVCWMESSFYTVTHFIFVMKQGYNQWVVPYDHSKHVTADSSGRHHTHTHYCNALHEVQLSEGREREC